MRTVYAVVIEVRPRDKYGLNQELVALQRTLAAWVEGWYERNQVSTSVIFDGDARTPRAGHEIVASYRATETHTLIDIAWSYPHQPDPTILWQTECTIASDGMRIEVAVVVRISSLGFVVKPVTYDLKRPRIVSDVLESFDCYSGAVRQTGKSLTIDTEGIDQFVDQVLMASGRSVPVVVVSPDLWTDRAIVDIGTLQDTLKGLATVGQLRSKWAAFKLTDRVGKELSCFNGAVRVYWPGFTFGAASHDHPLFLPASIRFHQERGRPLSEYLFRHLAAISAFRFRDGEVTVAAQTALENASRRDLDNLREKARSGATSMAETEALLKMAFDESKRLDDENRKLRDKAQELGRERDGYRANLEAVWQHQLSGADVGASVEQPAEISEPDPDSVADALDRVGKQCKDILEVWDTALQSALASSFARPEQAMRALLAVADLGREYFQSRRGKQGMGPWEDFFNERGFKYAAQEAQNTLTMHGKHRDFTNRGRKLRMLKHVTIGGGDRVNCLQIYFEPDDKSEKILIGYCGEHLPYYRQGT